MKRLLIGVAMGIGMSICGLAGEAQTSASAGSGERGGGATATARYDAPIGFANAETRSGKIELARGVAVGVDRSGVTLSVSTALATRSGPAIASTFNLAIDRSGDVSRSGGVVISSGPIQREATASGSAASGGRGGEPATTALASGRSDPLGRVEAQTHSKTDRVRTIAAREVGERRDGRVIRVQRSR